MLTRSEHAEALAAAMIGEPPTANVMPYSAYYDSVAEFYHLFYRDWQATMQREGAMLRRQFRGYQVKTVLDASCGLGLQSIPLALKGIKVTAVDASRAMLHKAKGYAAMSRAKENIKFFCTDMLELPKVVSGPFDAVISKSSMLLHLLTDDQLQTAINNLYSLLRPGGLMILGLRDYDMLLEDRPRFIPRQLHIDEPEKDVILFEVWDWNDGPPVTVTCNTFIVSGKGDEYKTTRHPVTYRALTRDELEKMLKRAGFTSITSERDAWETIYLIRKPE